jgi:hypothetical protein
MLRKRGARGGGGKKEKAWAPVRQSKWKGEGGPVEAGGYQVEEQGEGSGWLATAGHSGGAREQGMSGGPS